MAQARVAEIDRQIRTEQQTAANRLAKIRRGRLLTPEAADELAEGLGI